MGLKTGLTNRTTTNLQLNAGVFLKSYTKGGTISESNIIGATRGGGSFSAVPTIHQVAVDGAPTYVKGLERVDDWVVTMSVNNFLEFTPDALVKALGVGTTATTSQATGDTTITSTRNINASDYHDIYWVGDTSNGKNIVIHLKNCLNLTGLVVTTNDRGEGTYPLTFTAHFTPANLDTAPYELIIEGDTPEPSSLTAFSVGQSITGIDFGNVQNGEKSVALEEFLASLTYNTDGIAVIVSATDALLTAYKQAFEETYIYAMGYENTMVYSSMAYEEVLEGFNNLTDGKCYLSEALEVTGFNSAEGWNGVLIGAIEDED